jgi:sulfur-oxidizing protein SoxY
MAASMNDAMGRQAMRRIALAGAALVLMVGGAAAEQAKEDRWQTIKDTVFPGRAIGDGDGIVELDAPYRAEDAAVVPIAIRAKAPKPGAPIARLHLIIDNNPSPVASVIDFAGGRPSASIATRVRVDEYTHMRAIAETSDGALYMTARYVKAAGGCSAPAGKDQAAALARLGRMKLVLPEQVKFGEPVTAQLLISHPNNSGLQFDQVTGFYVPANYLQTIAIAYDGKPVLHIDSDISLSADPSIRFTFTPPGPGALTVRAVDTEKREFTGAWPVNAAGGT